MNLNKSSKAPSGIKMKKSSWKRSWTNSTKNWEQNKMRHFNSSSPSKKRKRKYPNFTVTLSNWRPSIRSSNKKSSKFRKELFLPLLKKKTSSLSFSKSLTWLKSMNLPTAQIWTWRWWNFKKNTKSCKTDLKQQDSILNPFFNKNNRNWRSFSKNRNIKSKSSKKEWPDWNRKSKTTKNTFNTSTKKELKKKTLKRNTTFLNKNLEKVKRKTQNLNSSFRIWKNNSKSPWLNLLLKRSNTKI